MITVRMLKLVLTLIVISTAFLSPTTEAKTVVWEHHENLARKARGFAASCEMRGGTYDHQQFEAPSGDQIGHSTCTDTETGQDFDCSYDTETTICEVPDDVKGEPQDERTVDTSDVVLHDGEPTPTPVPVIKG